MYHAKELPKRFHLKGDTIEFRQRTKKLKLHDNISSSGKVKKRIVGTFSFGKGNRYRVRGDREKGGGGVGGRGVYSKYRKGDR